MNRASPRTKQRGKPAPPSEAQSSAAAPPPDPERDILEIIERERGQLGQELHDGLCQHLGGVALLAKTLSNALHKAVRPEAEQAQELAQLIYSAVEQTRAVARGLRPVEMDEGGLLEALRDLAEQSRIPCEIRTRGVIRVRDNELATHLYRIAKEAVANAIKHSRAARILMQLRQSADFLTLRIEDDGEGMPATLLARESMGLRVMQYRANSIRALLTIVNGARGVIVTCRVPLLG